MKGYPVSLLHQALLPMQSSHADFLLSVRDHLLEEPAIHDHPYALEAILGDKDAWEEVIRLNDLSDVERILSLNELGRLYFSHKKVFSDSSKEEMRKDPKYHLIEKIRVCYAKWGAWGTITWNELVSFYNQLRTFRIGEPDFSITLDWTTGFNERGYSTYSRTFLDGVFAFLVHHKGKHVMTIGFSLADDGKLLIQQVQLVNKKGNRFLFQLPTSYMSWVLTLFKSHFIGREIYLVTGESLAYSIIEQYTRGARDIRHTFSWKKKFMRSEGKEQVLQELFELRAEHRAFIEKALRFKAKDFDRLVTLYGGDEGKHCITRNCHTLRLLTPA